MKKLEKVIIGTRLRQIIQSPYRLLDELNLGLGHTFLDVGCGNGFLTFPAALRVGGHGRVLAVDVDDEYLEEIRRKAVLNGFNNITTLRTRAEELEGVEDNSIDRAALMLSLHHFDDVAASFKQLRRKMKKNGVIMIVDPISSRFFRHGTNPEDIVLLLLKTGFKPISLHKGILLWKTVSTVF